MQFIKFPIELFDLRDPAAIVIAMRIIMRMDKDGWGVCFETRTSMCDVLGIDKKTWTVKIKLLESKGWIMVGRRPKTPHQITLTDYAKNLLRRKNHPVTRSNIIDLDCGGNFPQIGDHMSEEKPKKEKRKAVRRRRPANKIQQSDPILSEIDGIHRRWLKKQAEKKDTDPQD